MRQALWKNLFWTKNSNKIFNWIHLQLHGNCTWKQKKTYSIYLMQKKMYIPRLPSTIEDFEKFVSDEKYHKYFSNDHRGLPFYRGIWTSAKGERNLVYIYETLLKLTEFFIDGTFKALPHHLQFRQLYVISVTFNHPPVLSISLYIYGEENFYFVRLYFRKSKIVDAISWGD